MASVAGIRAGRAYVEIGADRTPLTRALRQSERDLKRFGRSFADLGKRMMGAGAAIAAPVSLSVKTFASFDDQMRIVQAVTGATAGEFAKLTEQAKELGRTTSFTAAQVAAGMVELGRAGFASNEISDAIGGVMDLARATATEVPSATQIASGALRAFGLNASDMARVCDVLTVAANGSAQTLGDMGEALKYVAPLASQAGMTLEDTSKIIGALANFSVKGSQAGTVFKNVLMQMADPAIQEKFRAIGVETVDMNGKLRNAADVLLDVGRATAKLPNAQRLDVFKGLFGKIGLAGGAALTKANFDDFYKSIDAAAGKAKDVAGQMDSGIGGSFRLLASAVEGSMIALGESLAPELESVSSKIQDVSARATAWIQDNKELIKSFMLLAKNLVIAGAELYVVGKGFQVLGSAVGIAGKVVNLTASFKNLGKTLGVLKAVVASSFGPFALLATVVGGAAVALGTKYVIAAKKADDAMRSSAEAVKKQVAAHQAAQAELQNSFRRLQELSEQQVLTDSEMEEAAKLVGELSDAYGDLGITLDKTARKLTIAADAQDKFNEAQRRQKLEDIRIQEDQLAKENQYIEKKLKGLTGAGGVARELGSYFKFNKNIQTRMDELYGRQNEIIRERSFLKEQRNLLTGKAPLSAAAATAPVNETAPAAAATAPAFTNEMRASAEEFESRMGAANKIDFALDLELQKSELEDAAAPTPAATTAAASTAETAAKTAFTNEMRASAEAFESRMGAANKIDFTLDLELQKSELEDAFANYLKVQGVKLDAGAITAEEYGATTQRARSWTKDAWNAIDDYQREQAGYVSSAEDRKEREQARMSALTDAQQSFLQAQQSYYDAVKSGVGVEAAKTAYDEAKGALSEQEGAAASEKAIDAQERLIDAQNALRSALETGSDDLIAAAREELESAQYGLVDANSSLSEAISDAMKANEVTTELASTGTFNAFEALDLSQDWQRTEMRKQSDTLDKIRRVAERIADNQGDDDEEWI